MVNPNGMVASEVSQASSIVERDSALRMARAIKGAHQKTSGADKAYDIREFVADLCISGIRHHLPQILQPRRRSVIDRRTPRHQGFAQSINTSKQLE
jgi:hypothetical protein